MSDQKERLLDLLERAYELKAQGQEVCAAELCADCPKLAEELEKEMRLDRWLERQAAPAAAADKEAVSYGPGIPIIPNHDILKRLGEGGMGVVYKARDRRLPRTVALKVIKDRQVGATDLARFQLEAQSLAQLNHPHIVQVYEVGRWQPPEGGELPYLSLEYVEGHTLAERIRDQPVAPVDAARLLYLLAGAVLEAHEAGIVHRDLKPGNVMLAPPVRLLSLNCVWGCPKVADFGLARPLAGSAGLTLSGAVMGTPEYMAPEQAAGRGEEVGPPADVYGLGGILYRMLTGRAVFQGANVYETLQRVVREPPVPPRELFPDVPEALNTLCLGCLQKEPARRPSVAALIEELEQFLKSDSTAVPPSQPGHPPPGPSVTINVTLSGADAVQLAKLLARVFNLSELNELAQAKLNLHLTAKATSVREAASELVAYVNAHGRVGELLAVAQASRPHDEELRLFVARLQGGPERVPAREQMRVTASPKAPRTYRAFVSSTFLDLKEHRKCVIDALQKAGIHVDPMENWTADSDEPKELSQKRVEGCDLCVLLVALRRGVVSPGQSLSITQMEYEAARKLNLSILVYLFDDSGDYLWPRRFDELHSDPRIRTWRQELKERHVCTFFDHHPEPLGQKVLAAVSRWLQEKVQDAIGPRPLTPAALNFTDFFDEKRRHFVGRQWLFDEIEAWSASGTEHALLVKGDPGAGKSAIVAELVHRNPGGRVLAYHCCQADVSDTLLPGRFVHSLVAQLVARVAGFSARLATPSVAEDLAKADSDPVRAFRRAVLDPLTPADGEKPCVRYLVIDALDEALAYKGAMTIVDVLVKVVEWLPAGVRVVATTRKEQAILSRLSGLRSLELDAQSKSRHNRKDIEDYIAQRLEVPALVERLRGSGRATVEVQRILANKSDGNFLYVQQALQGIERDQYRFDELEELPPGLGGLYLGFFERHFPTAPSYEDVRRVLEVVVAAREPLTEEQIGRATRLDTRELVPAVLDRLGSYLPNRSGRYALYHPSLSDWLKRDESRPTYHVTVVDGHRRLAEYCEREIGQSDPDRLARESPYAIRYRGAHLLEEGAPVERFRPLVAREWYQTWLALDGTGVGYLEDLERVWRAAEHSVRESLRRGEPANDLALEIQCALCRASVQELLRNVPEGLMRELVKRRIWSPAQGLAHARQIVQLRQRTESLLFLSAHCPQEQKLSVLQEVLELLPQVPESQERDSRFRELAEWFDRNGRPEVARSAALQIGDPNVRDRTLVAVDWSREVADLRRRHQLAMELGRVEDALAAALQIGLGEERDELLGQCIRSLSAGSRASEALAATREVIDPSRRARLLWEVGHHEDALGDARRVADPANRADLLVEFGRPEEALVPARAIADPERRAKLLARLGFAQEALKAACDVHNLKRRAELIMELGGSLRELEGTEEMLAAARDFPDPVQRANLLLELGQAREALAAAREAANPARRAVLLEELRRAEEAAAALRQATAPAHRAELMRELHQAEAGLATARQVTGGPERRVDLMGEEDIARAEAALATARQMADLSGQQDANRIDLEAALATARQMADPKRCVDLLVKLGQPKEALAVVREVADPARRADLMLELGEAEEAVVAARQVTDPNQRAELLLTLGREDEALTAAREVTDPERRIDLMVKLGRMEEALAAAREATDPARLAKLLAKFGRRDEALTAARQVTDPARLAKLLVKLGQPEEALTAARQVTDPVQRADLLLKLGRPEEAVAILDSLLLMPDASSRNEQVAEVVRYFVSKGDPHMLLGALRALPIHQAFDSLRCVSLLAVMGRFAPDHFRQAIEEVARITGTADRARIVAALVSYLPGHVLPEARQTLVAVYHSEALAVGLTGFARRAAQLGCLDEALASLDLLPGRRKEQALVDLLNSAGGPLPALEARRLRLDACNIENAHLAARGLAGLVRKLVRQQEADMAWAVVSEDMRALCEGAGDSLEEEWANALIALVPTLPPGRHFAAFMFAQALEGTRERGRVVEALAPHLSDPDLKQAVRLLQAFEDEEDCNHFLNEAACAAAVPAMLESYLRRALALRSPASQAAALVRLAPALPAHLLDQARNTAVRMPTGWARVDLLVALARQSAQRGDFAEALDLARELPDDPSAWNNPRVRALEQLAEVLHEPGQLDELRAELRSLRLDGRTGVLLELAARLPAGAISQPGELLQAVRRIASSAERLRAFTTLARHLPDDLLAEGLAVVAGFPGWSERIRALAALAPQLRAPHLDQALAQAHAIKLPAQRTRALIALASHLPDSERETLLAEADQLPNMVERVEALGALAGLLRARPRRLAQDRVLDAFRRMRDPVEQVTALRLLPSPEEVLPMLAATLEAVAALGNGHQRCATLAQLAPWLARLETRMLHDAWQKALPILALRSRRELLADCKALLPALVHLGGSGSLAGACQAVEHVREWWP